MITKKEADKRIKRWKGPYNQTKYKRGDGFEFIITNLYYEMQEASWHNKNIKREPIPKRIDFEWTTKQVVVDSFIHPVK